MQLDRKTAKVLLALVISARATSFMFSKVCLDSMSTLSLLSVRFLLASAVMLVFFHRRIFRDFAWSDLGKGVLFGAAYFCTMFCELSGLQTVDSGVAAFLENLAIVLVPLASAALMLRMPGKKTTSCACLALVGVALLTLGGQSVALSAGVLWLLAAAGFYTAAIVMTDRLSRRGNAFGMGFFQISTIGVLSTIFGACSGDYAMPGSIEQWLMICILALVCTCFGFTLQPVAQSKLSSEEAALFCALSPLVASILGVVFLNEQLTVPMAAGEVLILASLLLGTSSFAQKHDDCPSKQCATILGSSFSKEAPNARNRHNSSSAFSSRVHR